ncbi:MAG: flagellar export chaperone FliS [Gammaproteobacteria bacterium]|nr:MAG: flagellar export chaperone FliS [Gammaproteobacteria bacterium]PCH64193.1 MAG: flagellar export chaperone FliS [Gammaproteobacteria bacterium]
MNIQGAVQSYSKVANESGVMNATPYRIIQMLMAGALDRISAAKGLIKRGDIIGKGKQVSDAISIINGLRRSLDHKIGGEIAANLDALYDYMVRQLMHASVHNDIDILDEVGRLLNTIKNGWDNIPDPAAGKTGVASQSVGISA